MVTFVLKKVTPYSLNLKVTIQVITTDNTKISSSVAWGTDLLKSMKWCIAGSCILGEIVRGKGRVTSARCRKEHKWPPWFQEFLALYKGSDLVQEVEPKTRFRNDNYVSREMGAGNAAWKRRSRREFVASWSPGNKAEKGWLSDLSFPPVAAGQSRGSTSVNTQGPSLVALGMLLKELSTKELSPRANSITQHLLIFQEF